MSVEFRKFNGVEYLLYKWLTLINYLYLFVYIDYGINICSTNSLITQSDYTYKLLQLFCY